MTVENENHMGPNTQLQCVVPKYVHTASQEQRQETTKSRPQTDAFLILLSKTDLFSYWHPKYWQEMYEKVTVFTFRDDLEWIIILS